MNTDSNHHLIQSNHGASTSSIIRWFEQNAKQHCDQTAVIYEDQQITYGDLNHQAEQLAHYLRQNGVCNNTIVAIYLERSIQWIVCIIAIVKAGGAYVSLDLDTPAYRNQLILHNSQPVCLITDSSVRSTLVIPSSIQIIQIDSMVQQENIMHDEITNDSNALLCIMYTSGSTGQPKGCRITQRSVLDLVTHMNCIQIQSTDRIAQIGNPTFDITLFEIWGALLNGAKLQIVSRKYLLSFTEFNLLLKNKSISILFITTAYFNAIIKTYPDTFDNLRSLIFGGEKSNVETVRQLLRRRQALNLFHLNIIHAYGPTENTVFSTLFFLNHETDLIKNSVPIGKPIAKTRTYILNQELKQVTPGSIGELYLGGAGLALGYLNLPEQTEQKFIPSPWDPTEIIYKTGDLVYELPEVGLIFVDRVDRQIKIRGFRVELTEIEACIGTYPNIIQALVLMIESELIAYIQAARKIDCFELHQFLKKHIPIYMLPKKIIQIDTMPMTENGKIDQARLKQLHQKNISISVSNDRTECIETIIAQVWKHTLNTDIDVAQNIFDLGAHSLLLNQVCVVLNEKLKPRKVTVLDLLTYPTVQSLAVYLDTAK
jgi:amino acid adenylation domain-containing protein